MKAFKTLFMMQLKEKLDLSSAKSFKSLTLKAVFAVLIFLAVMAIAYFVYYLCIYLNLFSPLGYLPVNVMSVVFLVLLVFSLIACTVTLCRTLFRSSDNRLLMTFPVQPGTVYLSKICVSFIYELRRTFYFLMPIFLAYAIISKLPWFSYLWIIFMLVLFTAFMVMFAGFLALPVNYAVRFFKKHRVTKYIVGIMLLAAVVVFVIWLIGLIPSDINIIRSWSGISQYLRKFLDWFCDSFYFCYAFAMCLLGRDAIYAEKFFDANTWIVLAVIVAGIILFAAVNLLISRYAYAKVAGQQYEFGKKRAGRAGKDRKLGKNFSSLYYDGKRTLLDNNLLTSIIAVIIITPVCTLLLNAVFAAISKRVIGDYLAVSFNVLVVLLFATSSNVWVSSIYSRDGEALAIHKTKPVKPFASLFTRLVLSIMTTVLVVVPASVIFLSEAGMSPLESVWVILAELLVALGHLLWSAEMDISNPKPRIYATSGSAGVNPNELKSVALSFFLSLVTTGVFIFFLMYGEAYVYLRIFTIAAVFAGYRLIVFGYKSRVMYEEM